VGLGDGLEGAGGGGDRGTGSPVKEEERCFCQLDSHLVEDCGCSADIIEAFNRDKIYDQVGVRHQYPPT
jgi:hypothetical protein